jgi:hypothetical protein
VPGSPAYVAKAAVNRIDLPEHDLTCSFDRKNAIHANRKIDYKQSGVERDRSALRGMLRAVRDTLERGPLAAAAAASACAGCTDLARNRAGSAGRVAPCSCFCTGIMLVARDGCSCLAGGSADGFVQSRRAWCEM